MQGAVVQRVGSRLVPMALTCVSFLSACAREDEAALRARLAQWFMIGDSVEFSAQHDCAAATYRLRGTRMKSALPVTSDTARLLHDLARHGVAALDDPALSPDAALIDLTNADRPTGMTIRRVALEARRCMGGITESAFRYALQNPATVLAYDSRHHTLMLLDRATGVLVTARGAS